MLAAKVGALAVLTIIAVWLLNTDRALNKGSTVTTTPDGKIVRVPHTKLEGVPWVVPVILVLVWRWPSCSAEPATAATSTRSAATTRPPAGPVSGSTASASRYSSSVRCWPWSSGIVLASQIGVNNGEGGGNTLLLAVGAAVIGGTSLFGGKGKITDAVVGGLVVAVIINGMSDLLQGGNNAAYQAIVTGAVLTLAATVDALSRRRAGSTGLG